VGPNKQYVVESIRPVKQMVSPVPGVSQQSSIITLMKYLSLDKH